MIGQRRKLLQKSGSSLTPAWSLVYWKRQRFMPLCSNCSSRCFMFLACRTHHHGVGACYPASSGDKLKHVPDAHLSARDQSRLCTLLGLG